MKKTSLFCIILFVLWQLSTVSVDADPIVMPEKPVTSEITFTVVLALALEVICIVWILRRSRRPRFFALWLVGIHLLTYPTFIGFLWLEQNIRPALAAGIGEGAVIILEGVLIYLICQFIPAAKPDQPPTSLIKSLLASLAGNLVSAIGFPILLSVYSKLI